MSAAQTFVEPRERPPFEPRALSCPSCGSPLTVQDERATFVICSACDSEVGLTAAEARVLGKRSGLEPAFALELGRRLVFDGHPYEVTARLSYRADDDDITDPRVHSYLLFSPRRGSLWLSVWAGHWDLSWTSYLAPKKLPGGVPVISTFDGRMWKVDETGEQILEWVDGALPWVARTGDVHSYAECSGPNGETYEVTRTLGELEFAEGRKLSTAEVYEALGDEEAAARARKEAHKNRPPSTLLKGVMIGGAAVGMLVCLVGLFAAMGSGTLVHEQVLRPSDFTLGDELRTPAFPLGGGLVEVELDAPRLSNAWVSVDLALMEATSEDTVLHVDDADVEYYSGVEGGESWSEGSRSTSKTWHVPDPGQYRMLVRARGNTGNANTASAAPTSVVLRVKDGVMAWWWPLYGLVFCGALFGASIVSTLMTTKGSS